MKLSKSGLPLSSIFPYAKTLFLIFIISFFSYFLEPFIGYRAVGFIFLFGVIITGLWGHTITAVLAATLSVFLWNFFFIPPRLTFLISHPEDLFMGITYFIIAATTGVLTSRIKRYEQDLKDSEVLKESEKLHQTLLNSISHELRTPLTTIMGIASEIEDDFHDKNTEYQREVAKQLCRSSDRLNRVIENLLDMSRLNSGVLTLKKEWHDLHDLIGVISNRMDKSLKNHDIKFVLPDNIPLIKVDFRLLEHAITNILMNAVAYTPERSSILLSIGVNNSFVYVSVEDGGNGIPDYALEKIFEKFYRVPGTPAGGTGLGLSIVKSIVELHQGFVKVSNRAEGGAKFVIYLPLEELPELPKEVLDGP